MDDKLKALHQRDEPSQGWPKSEIVEDNDENSDRKCNTKCKDDWSLKTCGAFWKTRVEILRLLE